MLVGKFGSGPCVFGVEDEIDVALSVVGDILVAVPAHRDEAELFELLGEPGGIRAGELDEFEPVGAQRVCDLLRGIGLLARHGHAPVDGPSGVRE